VTRHFTYAVSEFIAALDACATELDRAGDERAVWLASFLQGDVLPIAREIYHSSPSDETWLKIISFQLAKTRAARERAVAQIADLDAKEAKLLARYEARVNAKMDAGKS
jgi:hypothetical protein